MIILVTGKPGSGKTYYARTLCEELMREGRRVYVFDGDEVRKANNNNDFSDEGRLSHLIIIAKAAKFLEKFADVDVIIAVVAPKKEWRDIMRSFWKKSRLVHLPGGSLWPGTSYERPMEDEF